MNTVTFPPTISLHGFIVINPQTIQDGLAGLQCVYRHEGEHIRAYIKIGDVWYGPKFLLQNGVSYGYLSQLQ